MSDEGFSAGTYVLTVDHYEKREYTDDSQKELKSSKVFRKGQEVELSEADANRLGRATSVGNTPAIAKPDSLEAKVAKGEIEEEYAPSPTASVDQLEAQKEAVEQAIKDRKNADEKEEAAREETRNPESSATPQAGSPNDPEGAGNTSKRQRKASS